MSYTNATAADLKARFPAFDAVAEATVIAILTEALEYVSDEWASQADYTYGQLLYAAHIMTLDGLGVGTEAELASQGLLGFKSITSGKLSVSRDTGASNSGSADVLMQTQYGKRFKELQARNVPTFYTC